MKKFIMGFVIVQIIVLIFYILPVMAHPGNKDANGCHTVKATGEYHCHGGSGWSTGSGGSGSGTYSSTPTYPTYNSTSPSRTTSYGSSSGTSSSYKNNLATSDQSQGVSTVSPIQGLIGKPTLSPSKECNIKGIIGPISKLKIYLLPDHYLYPKINVYGDMGEKWLCSEAEAIAEGFLLVPNKQ